MAKCDFKLENHKAKWTAKPVFTFMYAELKNSKRNQAYWIRLHVSGQQNDI